MFEQVKDRFGRLDFFISNASASNFRPIDELKPEHLERTFNLNVRAFVLGTQRAARLMDRGGRIVVLSSYGSLRTFPTYANLGSAKAALETWARYMAVELAPAGHQRQCAQSRDRRVRLLGVLLWDRTGGVARHGHPEDPQAAAGFGPGGRRLCPVPAVPRLGIRHRHRARRRRRADRGCTPLPVRSARKLIPSRPWSAATARRLRFRANCAPERCVMSSWTSSSIVLREGPEPETPPGYARVRVLACGVCATDLHLLRGMVLPPGASYPIRPGHEVAGIVEHVNADDARIAEGDLVVLHPLASCGECPACMRGEDQRCAALRTLGVQDPGGFAEFVVWPASRMLPANGIAPAAAALLADAAATAHNAFRAANLPPGGALCVFGAGGLGMGALAVARALDPDARLAAVVRSEASAAAPRGPRRRGPRRARRRPDGRCGASSGRWTP